MLAVQTQQTNLVKLQDHDPRTLQLDAIASAFDLLAFAWRILCAEVKAVPRRSKP